MSPLRPYRRLLPYLRRYRARYLAGALLVFAAVTLRLCVPSLLGDALDVLRQLADRGDRSARGQLGWLAALIVAAALCGAGVRTASRLLILGNSRRAVHDLREDVFAHLLKLAPSFYTRHQTGQIMSRCVNDMQNVQGLMGPVFLYLVETGVLYAVGLAFMLSADPLSAVVGLLPFPFFLWYARRVAARIQRGSRAAQEQLGEVSAKVDESLSGHKIVKSLVLEDHDRERFAAECDRYRSTMISVARDRAALQPTMLFLTASSSGLVLAVGGPRVAAGDLAVGDPVSLIIYLGLLAAPTGILGFVISSLQRGAAALARIGELFEMPVTIREPERPLRGVVDRGRIEVRDLTVEFAPLADQPHLSGSLPDDPDAAKTRRRVLDGVSLVVPAGSTLGVVGPTGSGKTTLARALSRQLEIEPGHVFVDGNDITEVALDELRRTIGVVPQETFLFSATLADNVALGRPDASRESIVAAVQKAQLHKDLPQLKDGLDTMLGERGVNLSGGQRQRTALARVILLEPSILILDDTLSAVDTDTAEAILEGVRPMMADRTTVIVAHRVATVRHAEQIVVLDEGRIVERGTHEQLLQRDGLYAALDRQQNQDRQADA